MELKTHRGIHVYLSLWGRRPMKRCPPLSAPCKRIAHCASAGCFWSSHRPMSSVGGNITSTHSFWKHEVPRRLWPPTLSLKVTCIQRRDRGAGRLRTEGNSRELMPTGMRTQVSGAKQTSSPWAAMASNTNKGRDCSLSLFTSTRVTLVLISTAQHTFARVPVPICRQLSPKKRRETSGHQEVQQDKGYHGGHTLVLRKHKAL